MWIYIVDMHFHILADVFFFDNMNSSSKLFNPTSFVIEPKYLGEQMKDDVFRKEWETLQPEHEINLMLIKARQEHHLTQKQLAAICGVRQSNLSRIETGAESPSVRTLCKIAKGLGKRLQIQFV